MRILVAGGAGYIGSALVPELIRKGHSIDVVDLLWFGNHLPKTVNVINRNISSLGIEDVSGYDQVIFLAGLSNDPMAEFSPIRNFIENGSIPAYLAYISKCAGVKRYIYASSCSVYGHADDQLVNETCKAVSIYPYGIAKLQGEYASMQLQDDKFSVICLRQGTVVGYSPRMRFDLVVNAMFSSAINDQVINVHNPIIWRPLLGIRDAITGYIGAIDARHEVSGIFNIASGNFTIEEIASEVKEAIKKHINWEVTINTTHLPDHRSYRVDITRIKNTLGFRSTHTVDQIVQDLLEKRAEIGDFNNEQYYNIRMFTKMSGSGT